MNEPRIAFGRQLADFFRRNAVWFFAAALSLLLLQDLFGTHGVLAMRRAQQETSSVRKEINQLNEENGRLQESVKSLRNDPAAIERIAREEMGLARPGEYIFRLPPNSGNASTPAPAAAPPSPPAKP